ncbi:hypothetical protein BBD42_15425 [Paenibacillus sp. BIHB 4019]|uniref:DNA-directed DNA polymerase n=1 Tax=Paenibacillus sp. BIHB 4019 TaxID=1870819 RepID=A0A1B2DJ30_9BACL|nr:DNA polymerase [Paenibacillus sp. BIHB 4019]ANY67701.1 hypothetical protein BBD42_15425 [Paenibacillus sp. BIHB 4019]
MSLVVTDANYHEIVRKLIADEQKIPKGTNCQNLPSKGAGTLVRNCFVPRAGSTFVGADLGAIEPRIQAHIMYTRYGDNSMRQIFLEGGKLYEAMAMKTFGFPLENCVDGAYDPTGTFQPRKMMKTGQLAVSYDQSQKSFAKKMNVSEEVAEFFFRNFDETFPSFRLMVADIRNFMRKNGYVETLFHRKRRFPDYASVAAAQQRNEQRLIRLYTERKQLNAKSPQSPRDAQRLLAVQDEIDVLAEKRGLIGYWERAAFNAVIQGTGADILKMNGNRNARVCKERGWEFNASIHDEIKNSVPNADLTPDTIALIDDIMTQTVELSVPLVTDIVIEPRWMQEYAPSEWDFAACRPKAEYANKYE